MSNRRINPMVVPTKDGSSTLYSQKFDQHYHNPNGAMAESRHVFFETPGIPDFLDTNKSTNIFEVGFGSGLNLVLLLDYLHKKNLQEETNYFSIEAFPIEAEAASNFNYGDELAYLKPNELLQNIFKDLSPGLNKFSLDNGLTLHLFISLFDDLSDSDLKSVKPINFVFHDAFSPDVNPDLWTPEVFKKLKFVCQSDAVLSTYCAASSARAAMAVSGWYPARGKGALGKREMTIASPTPDQLDGFKRVNEKRLIERFKRGDFD